MSWQFRTLVIDAAHRDFAALLCETLAGPSGGNMFTTQLSADGKAPATHYVSTGYIEEEFAQLLPLEVWKQDEDGTWVMEDMIPGKPAVIVALAAQKELEVTIVEVEQALAALSSTTLEPFVDFARMGIQMVTEEPI